MNFLISLKLLHASQASIPWKILHGLLYHSAVFFCSACPSFHSAWSFYVRNPRDPLLADEGSSSLRSHGTHVRLSDKETVNAGWNSSFEAFWYNFFFLNMIYLYIFFSLVFVWWLAVASWQVVWARWQGAGEGIWQVGKEQEQLTEWLVERRRNKKGNRSSRKSSKASFRIRDKFEGHLEKIMKIIIFLCSWGCSSMTSAYFVPSCPPTVGR